MKIGLQIPSFTWPGGPAHIAGTLGDIARLADAAWKEFAGSAACKNHATEYEKGFKAGFIDYLDCNGNGQPPAAPPPHLRSSILRTPKQQQDIDDWFNGFRLGADVAAQSRWRDRIVIPISQPPRAGETGYKEETIPPPRSPNRDEGVPGVATFETSENENP